MKRKVLLAASVASMIDQFHLPDIRLLQESGCEVHVACNFIKGNTCSGKRIRSLQERLRRMQVIWHQWDCPRSPYDAVACCRAYRQIWELTGRYAFAWIHCHSPVGGALARLAAYRRGIRVIYTAHGFHFYPGAPLKNWLLYYPAEKLLSYGTDVLITVNREDFGLAKRRMLSKKVCYIPGVGIDVDQRKPLAKADRAALRERFCRKYRIPQDAVILLSVGELSRRKNHRIVLSALAQLEREDVCYVICGKGECRRQLVRQAERLGISSRIRLAGFQEDLTEFYQSADLFVLPSLQEGMPAALMEAMAAGLPCIVSDIRGSRELVTARGGRVFALHTGCAAAGLRKQHTGCAAAGLRKQHTGCAAAGLREQLAGLLDCPQLWESYGRWNQEKIRRYDRAVVDRKMKRIYEEFMESEALYGIGSTLWNQEQSIESGAINEKK